MGLHINTLEKSKLSELDKNTHFFVTAPFPEGIISSFPVTCADGDYSIVQGLDLVDFSRGRIDASADELVSERDTVSELGLI